MYKLKPEEYKKAALYIDNTDCGGVYSRSAAELTQTGDVYSDGSSALFWHYCGFVLIYGECGDAFLDDIYDMFLSGKAVIQRRFVLFDRDGRANARFSDKPDILTGHRLFFEYAADKPAVTLPDGFELREITKELLGNIKGRIIPAFSWDSPEEFLEKGKGFCVTRGNILAAWAFSAAVSSDEIDTGVETAPEYRGLGLATAAAAGMVRYILSVGKKPVWACHSENTASKRLALKLGFKQTSECFTVSGATPQTP